MTSLGETYEKLMKFIRFFVNRAPGPHGWAAGWLALAGSGLSLKRHLQSHLLTAANSDTRPRPLSYWRCNLLSANLYGAYHKCVSKQASKQLMLLLKSSVNHRSVAGIAVGYFYIRRRKLKNRLSLLFHLCMGTVSALMCLVCPVLLPYVTENYVLFLVDR